MVPLNLIKMQQYLEQSYCIGINPKDSDLYYRLYRKVTDRMSPLSPKDHRLRWEVNLSRKELIKSTSDLLDIETLIKQGFKHIDFTKLSEDASEVVEQEYRQYVRPYGQEVTSFRSKSGNKRTLHEDIKLNAELNKIKRAAVSNLSRHFRRSEWKSHHLDLDIEIININKIQYLRFYTKEPVCLITIYLYIHI